MKRITLILLISFTVITSYSFGAGDSLKVKNTYQSLRIGVNAGLGFGSMRMPMGNTQFLNNYFEATGSYALTPRSGLLMGLGYSRINFTNPSFGAEGQGQTLFSDQYIISGGGYHHVNERLTLTGMAQFSVPTNGASTGFANPFGNTKNLDFNAFYKISDKFSIGAGIRYSEGNFGNGFGGPFMNPMNPFANPFSSPFRR
ncbi:MAG: hypothetical protein M3512_06715 [Bacteroidota bacterium]|nr:hypothetical protein [Bacteroidota bacterium]